MACLGSRFDRAAEERSPSQVIPGTKDGGLALATASCRSDMLAAKEFRASRPVVAPDADNRPQCLGYFREAVPAADANGSSRPWASTRDRAAPSGFDHTPGSIEHDRNRRQHDVVTAIFANVDARENDG
jgi:hypothetical protein